MRCYSMGNRPTVWLTRPLADSESLAAELASHHIVSLIAPVIRIEPQTVNITTHIPPAAILLTSRHAAHVLAALPTTWRVLPVYCVGTATAAAAAAYHFNHCINGDADVLALLPRIAEALPAQSHILYLASDETRVDVASLLAAAHLQVHTYIAYHAVAEPKLTDELRTAFAQGKLNAVTLFSPHTASLVCDFLKQHNLHENVTTIDAYCLSLNVAEAAAALPWASIHACHRPTRAAMVDLIVSHLSKT